MSNEMPIKFEDRNFIQHFFSLSSKFWSGPSRKTAWSLSLGFLASLIVSMLLAISINRWNKYFFDALEFRNIEGIKWSIVLILALSAGSAVASAVLIQTRMWLQLRWRQWLTIALIARWFAHRQSNKFSISGSIDNPEARIAEDGRVSVEIFVDLCGGLINTLLLSASFITVLFYVGGSLTLGGVTIPAYMVVAVVLYTAATSFGMYRLGWPLVRRVEQKAAVEGDFRYALTRTRERADLEARFEGYEDAQKMLELSFGALATGWIAVIGRQTRMIFLSGGNNVFAPALALLLGAPKYLDGQMTLGDVMQAAAAFTQVHTALNWLADNALSLANWSASARRVAALDLAYQEFDERALNVERM